MLQILLWQVTQDSAHIFSVCSEAEITEILYSEWIWNGNQLRPTRV